LNARQHPSPQPSTVSPTRHVDGHTRKHQNLIRQYDISTHFRLNHGPCRSQEQRINSTQRSYRPFQTASVITPKHKDKHKGEMRPRPLPAYTTRLSPNVPSLISISPRVLAQSHRHKQQCDVALSLCQADALAFKEQNAPPSSPRCCLPVLPPPGLRPTPYQCPRCW